MLHVGDLLLLVVQLHLQLRFLGDEALGLLLRQCRLAPVVGVQLRQPFKLGLILQKTTRNQRSTSPRLVNQLCFETRQSSEI